MISLLCEAVCTKGKDIVWLIPDKMARQDLTAVKAQQPEQPGEVSAGQKGTSFAHTKMKTCFAFFFPPLVLWIDDVKSFSFELNKDDLWNPIDRPLDLMSQTTFFFCGSLSYNAIK